jgi:hypothetical protein
MSAVETHIGIPGQKMAQSLISKVYSTGYVVISGYFYVKNPGTPSLRSFDKMDQLTDILHNIIHARL